jgi:acetolactate synthase I/II/III large subunit
MSRDLTRSLARGLHLAGVRTIFGMPGGGPNLDMIGSAQELGIGFLLAHGEFAACVMAATHGRLTGSPGVAVVTRGPGLTSATNGLAQATLDRFPLLLISDAVPAAHSARYAHQRLDQVAVTAPITKWSGVLGTADPSGVVAAAARLATTAPAGAVHLAFDPTVPGDVVPAVPAPPEIDRASLEEARRLLARSRRPVVIVGLDAARHTAAVRDMVEALNCPVFVTYQAKGVVPESWPDHAGLFTGAQIERPVLDEADVIVGIGLDPVEPTPTPWPYRAPVILLHSHPVETAYFGEPLLLVGPYDELHADLVDHWHSEWEPGGGGDARRRAVDRLEAPARGLSPHDVVRTTQHVLGDVPVTVDAGAHMLVVMPLWHTDEPDSVLISNGLATMGFALPAAIAAALARPRRRVVCFVGDGGLGMVLSELETLARLRLDVTVVVFNDATLTLIGLKQGNGQGDATTVGYDATDFAGVATALGIPSRVAEDVRGLEDALSSVQRGPLLVDARIDPSPYPHVIRVTRG